MFPEKIKNGMKQSGRTLAQWLFDICVWIGLFIILYFPPIFTFGSVHINAVHIVGVCSILYLLANYRFMEYVKRKVNLRIVGGFCLLLVYGAVLFFIHRTPLSNMTSQLYYLVDVLPFAFVVTDYGRKREFRLLNYLNLFIGVGVVQALVAIAAMAIPPLKQLFLDMMVEFGYGEIVTLMPFRMFGFSGQLTFAMPIVQSILAVICFYLCFTKSTKYYIPMTLLLVSAVINGRTSIVSFAVGVIAVLCCSRQWGAKRTLRTLRIPLYCIPAVIAGVIGLFYAMPATADWIFDGIGEIFSVLTGDSETPTFSFLMNPKWRRLPQGILLMFGVGSQIMYGYDNPALGIERVNSDIGYVNDIWYGGIVYAVILYGFFYYLFGRLLKCRSKLLRFVCVFFMLIMPLLNIKGIAFAMSGFTNLMVILIVTAVNMTYDAMQRGSDI